MNTRFKKSSSTIRFGVTTLVATAGVWLGSTCYAQTQSTPSASASKSLQKIFDERDHRFSQLPAFDEQQNSRLQPQRLTTNHLRDNPHTFGAIKNQQQPVITAEKNTPSSQTPSSLLSKLPTQSSRRLLKPIKTAGSANIKGSRASIVTDQNVRPVSSANSSIAARLTASPQTVPHGFTATKNNPPPLAAKRIYQLKTISIVDFENRLIKDFGNRLKVSSLENGRLVRVTLPGKPAGNGSRSPMVMLVDRETGKLQYEGDAATEDQWYKVIAEMDKPQLVENLNIASDIEAEILPAQETKQVAFQQDDQPQGSPVQGIPGLKGQVFIAQDPNGGGLTITGDPDDVAIVKREIARLSQEAQSAQPTPVAIPLENARGNLIQQRVQEIYDASYSQLNGPANLTATDSPNALVVVGSPKAVEAVRGLVKVLDVKPEAGATTDFRTFGLKFISANDAASRLRQFFGQVTVADGDTRIPVSPVEVIPDFRSNQVTVKGGPAIINSAAEFLKSIDVASVEQGAVNEVRVIQLKNALATDVAFVIQNAINGQLPNAGEAFASQNNGQIAQNTAQVVNDTAGNQSQLRSAMLSFMTRNKQGELIRSGILFDVRITADANSNSLVVTGPAESIPLIVELVKQLDRIPDAESQIKVFELVYSDAQTIFDMLDTLFNNNGQIPGLQNNGPQLPLQSGAGGDGASLINLRFSIEPRSNAIIASGPARDLQVIEDLLNRLDARAVNNFPAQVYRLSNAPAQDVADAINTYLDGRTDLVDADPRTATGVPAVNRSVIVTPEVVSNSLIVSALPEYRAEIENIIRSLDRRPPMVQVKVLIAEVDLNTVEEFGVELGLQDSLLFDRGTTIAAGGGLTGVGFPFNSSDVGNLNAFGRESLAGQALSNLNVGRVNPALGYGGLVLSAGNESVNILLRALKDRQAVRVLSKPQIVTMENLQGRVAIGASVARIAGSTQTNFGLTQDIEFRDVGVILEVTPRVSPDGLIVLTVTAEKSSVGPEAAGTAVGVAADGSIIRAQQVLMTEAQTTLSARSGQTVVLSGLITEEKVHSERGVPIISDLPLIGPLFKFESDTSSRSELLIIMTPTLITDDNDLTNLNHDAMDRMHWCLSDVADVYGSTDYGADVEIGESVETFYPDMDPTGTIQPLIHNSKLETPTQPTLGSVPETINRPTLQHPVATTGHAAAEQKPPTKDRSARRSRWNPFKRR